MIALHTFNKEGEWHCHFHILITTGGVPLSAIDKQKAIGYGNPDKIEGSWESSEYFPLVQKIIPSIKAICMKNLRKAHKNNQLKFEKSEEMWSYEAWDRKIQMHFDKELTWHIQIAGRKERNGANANIMHPLDYILRYVGHPPIKISTLVYNRTTGEVYWTPKGRTGIQLKVGEFARRMVQHFPGKHDRQIFYAGIYSTRKRNKELLIARAVPKLRAGIFTKAFREARQRASQKEFERLRNDFKQCCNFLDYPD